MCSLPFVMFIFMIIIHSVLSQIGTGILHFTLGVKFRIGPSVRGQPISLYSKYLSVSPIDCETQDWSIRSSRAFSLYSRYSSISRTVLCKYFR